MDQYEKNEVDNFMEKVRATLTAASEVMDDILRADDDFILGQEFIEGDSMVKNKQPTKIEALRAEIKSIETAALKLQSKRAAAKIEFSELDTGEIVPRFSVDRRGRFLVDEGAELEAWQRRSRFERARIDYFNLHDDYIAACRQLDQKRLELREVERQVQELQELLRCASVEVAA